LEDDIVFPAAGGDPAFYRWMVDAQERPAFGTHEGVPKQPRTWTATTSRAELCGAAGFARRFESITEVLEQAGVAPSKDISITYSSKKWMRKAGFHFKCCQY